MKLTRYALLICTFFFLAGCTSTGTKIQSNQLGQLVKDETTEQQVVEMFGKPNSTTLTPDRKILIYDHRTNNGVGRSVAASTGSVVGGLVAGSLGSIAGSVIGNSAVSPQTTSERLMVEISTASGKVVNYQFQQTP